MNHGRLVVPFSDWLTQCSRHNKTERDQVQEVVLHGETLVFVATAIAETVAEEESRSTFRECCLSRNGS